MSFFLFFMILFGCGSRFVHGAFCVKTKHRTRIIIVTLFTIASFVMIAISCQFNDVPALFWLAVISSMLTGISQSFGEAVCFGFIKSFPSYSVGDLSAGTGFAGIFATSTLLLCKSSFIDLSN